MRSLVYNYCHMKYLDDLIDNPQKEFKIGDSMVNFEEMTETVGSEVREIRIVGNNHIRLRPEDSDRVSNTFTN